MSKKSKSDYIREELNKDFNAPAAVIVERISKIKKSLICRPQQVYQVRSMLLKAQKTKEEVGEVLVGQLGRISGGKFKNNEPLGRHIVKILNLHPEGLSDRDLTLAIKNAGYRSNSSDFLCVVRQKLYSMVEKGHIAKNGVQYKLQNFNLALSENGFEKLKLLHNAVVDLAKTLKVKNPEGFPEALISSYQLNSLLQNIEFKNA
jgi:hypothetical protein